jgi:hypothetical protein
VCRRWWEIGSDAIVENKGSDLKSADDSNVKAAPVGDLVKAAVFLGFHRHPLTGLAAVFAGEYSGTGVPKFV